MTSILALVPKLHLETPLWFKLRFGLQGKAW
jgi:hypothetical protein